MATAPDDPTPDSPAELARQRLILKAVIALLLVMAVLVVTVVPKLPMPARIFIGLSDVTLAVVLWMVLRQKFSGKP
jgi:hypothetical protein